LKKINQIIRKADIGLVVLSSQAYKELWPIFFKSWNKYFKNIKIKKYVISAEENYFNNKYDFQVVSGDKMTINSSWSLRIKKGLKKIKHKNLFFTTEDMIFYKSGNFHLIKEFFEFYKINSPKYLRSSPIPPVLNNRTSHKFVNEPSWALHQITLQPALINRNFLIKNLNNKENSRDFEERISYINRNNKKIFSSKIEILPYKEIVIGGKIIRDGYSFFKNLKLQYPKKIKQMSIYEDLKFKVFKEFKFWIFYKLPINLIKFLIINDIVGYKKKFVKK